LRLLTQGTGSATPGNQQVLAERSIYALLFANLLTDSRSADEVRDGTEHDEGAHEALLSDLLSDLADSVAWTEVGHDTDGAVIEATT